MEQESYQTSLPLRKLNNKNSGKIKFLKNRLIQISLALRVSEQFFTGGCPTEGPSQECAWMGEEEDGAWKPQLTLCRLQLISKLFLIIRLFSMQKFNPIISNYAPMYKAKQIPSFCSPCPPRKRLYSISSRYP